MEGQHTDISVFAQTGGRNFVSESTEFEVLLPQGHFVHTLRRIQGLRGPSDSCWFNLDRDTRSAGCRRRRHFFI